MEELIQELIKNQAGIDQIESKREEASSTIDKEILKLETELEELMSQRDELRKPYGDIFFMLKTTQDEIKEDILKTWDGKNKTLKFDTGTLKFRTTTSLNIKNEPALLEDLMDHLSTSEEVMEYVTGFNKTAVKRYMGVHKMGTDVVELIAKTNVGFSQVKD